MTNNRIRIASLLMAMIIVGMIFVPAASAKKDKVDDEGNVTIQSITYDADYDISPYSASVGYTFDSEGEGTYEADVYGVPLPARLWLRNEISYLAFNRPEITSASWSSSFQYESNALIGKAWVFEGSTYTLGGPVTKHVYSEIEAKDDGYYRNVLSVGIGAILKDRDYEYVSIV